MTNSEIIIRKLTSRKLWLAIAGFVSGLLVALKVDAETAETISGLVMAGASVVAYIFGEGLADSAGAKADTVYIEAEDKPPELDIDDGK